LGNVTVYNERFNFNFSEGNVIYIDPPWGGQNYKDHPITELFLENEGLDGDETINSVEK
jgi:hypothetical protein